MNGEHEFRAKMCGLVAEGWERGGPWLIRVCPHGYRVEWITGSWLHMDAPLRDQGACSYGVERQEVVPVSRVSAPERDPDDDWQLTYEKPHPNDPLLRSPERNTERLQAAIDKAYSAMNESAYVGGPTEREAWQTALAALGEVVTQHTGQTEFPVSGESENHEAGIEEAERVFLLTDAPRRPLRVRLERAIVAYLTIVRRRPIDCMRIGRPQHRTQTGRERG